MSRSVAELNELLARSLGCNPYGEGMFRWENSKDMFWPEFPTGKTTTKMVEVPVIGGGTALAPTVVPEYCQKPMCPHLDAQWVVTLWYAPESLGHWQSQFPGAAYPARGWRINTNASLPSFPGGPREPNIADTERFIALLREQRSRGSQEFVAQDMIAEQDARLEAIQKQTADEVADSFTAFMNPNPGKRGGFVSLPQPQPERRIILP